MNKGVVQQIATPREIYDNPANLFVAGFIGSPPMNTLDGAIADGAFVAAEGKVPVGNFAPRPAVVFGFRPEDARLVDPAGADLQATVYACELTGNETIVTVKIGKAQAVVKMDKNYDVPVDTSVGIAIDRAKLRLFDPASGERIAA
jgi:multiple sugar transport system ATP-binding protein